MKTACTHLSKFVISNFIAERYLLITSLRTLKRYMTETSIIEDRRHALKLWINVLIRFERVERVEIDNVTSLHEFRKNA